MTNIKFMNLKQLYKIKSEYGYGSEGKDYQADISLIDIDARINEIEQKKLELQLKRISKEETEIPPVITWRESDDIAYELVKEFHQLITVIYNNNIHKEESRDILNFIKEKLK
jgi:hypothetical protein